MITNLGDLLSLVTDSNRVAIVDASQSLPIKITYKQLNELANQVANGLRHKGVSYGDRVAIFSKNSIESVATYFGILKVGAIVVFVNSKLPLLQVQRILDDSNSRLVFSDQDITTISLPSVNFTATFYRFLSDNKDATSYPVSKDDVAIILYTSGSTGKQKGVMLSHQSRIWAICKDSIQSTLPVNSLSAGPIYHLHGLTSMELVLSAGNTLILLSRFIAKDFIRIIEQYQIRTITAVPSMFAMILFEEELLRITDLSSVKQIIIASAPPSKNLISQVKRYFVNSKVSISYGLTEVGPKLFGPHPDGIPIPEMSVGYPKEGILYRLVDGVLQIKSPSSMSSYINFDKLSSFSKEYFITNDIFRVDEQGFYYFVGRADDMFVCGGNNIYPRQAEAILEDMPSVVSAAVIGLEDEVKGTKPYAFVISSSPITENELIEHLKSHLPLSHCPRKIWVIDSMPLNGNNKIDKHQLKELATKLLTAGSEVNKYVTDKDNSMNAVNEKLFQRVDSLDGKVVVITGGSGHIGHATAMRLAAKGARIVTLVRSNLEGAKELLTQLPNEHLKHFSLLASVTDTSAMKFAVQQIAHAAGRCDILVNAAGYSRHNLSMNDLTDEIFDEIVAINLKGTFIAVREFSDLLKSSGDGLVVNISSTAGIAAAPQACFAYSAAKAGVISLTRSLAKAMAPTVRVVGVAPGLLLNTVSGVPPLDDALVESIRNTIPLRRIGQVDDIASTIEACATTMRFASGTTFVIDGGRTS